MEKIVPCLWFNDQAEEAVRLYTSVFKDSRIKDISRYGPAAAEASGRPRGSVMTISFELEKQGFLALNGGPEYCFSPAISLIVNCGTQKEIDGIWEKLSADPAAEACGWLKDKYGVSWQIVPDFLLKAVAGKDADRSERVMQALVKMKKLDLKTLEEAAGIHRVLGDESSIYEFLIPWR